MTISNQLNFILKNLKLLSNPVLEIGSRIHNNSIDLRNVFNNHEYIGIDLDFGKGVDIILDFTKDYSIIEKKLNYKKFNTIICFSVLEHCINPFKMCKNISLSLNNKGIILISAPFSWRIHNYPSDYWRFTFEGIKSLFPNFKFFYKESSNKLLTDLYNYKSKCYGKFKSLFIKILRKSRLFPDIFNYPYILTPSLINMIGVKIK